MAKNDNNTILWIAGIAILIFLILPNIQQQKQDTGIEVLYYKDGVQVHPQKNLFSIVTPPGGSYDAIAFKITVTNNGQGPLTDVRANYLYVRDGNNIGIKFIYLNAQGDGNFPGVLVGDGNLAIGQSAYVISKQISTSQFESLTQPTKFSAGVSATNPYNNQVKGFDSPFLSLTITPYVQPSKCYQESANVSNPNCGALGTGKYKLSPYWLYINYTIPTGALDTSTWQVKYGGRATENITIPSNCWNYNPSQIQLRFYSNGANAIGNPSAYGQCYDGGWATITVVKTFPGGQKNSPAGGGNKYLYDGDWNTGAYSYYGNQLFYQRLYSFDDYSTIYEEAMNWKF